MRSVSNRGHFPRRLVANLAVALLSACGGVSPIVTGPDGQEAIVNGSFEVGQFSSNYLRGIMTLGPNDTALAGWQIAVESNKQTIAWIDANNDLLANGASDGKRFLDLTGNNDVRASSGFAWVQQTFATIPGAAYQVSFDIGVYNPKYGGPVQVQLTMSSSAAGGDYFVMNCGPFDPSQPGPSWMNCTESFVAEGNSTVVKIRGVVGTKYIGLDKVSVQCIATFANPAYCGRGLE